MGCVCVRVCAVLLLLCWLLIFIGDWAFACAIVRVFYLGLFGVFGIRIGFSYINMCLVLYSNLDLRLCLVRILNPNPKNKNKTKETQDQDAGRLHRRRAPILA